jgi:DnaJ family protein A protein 2
MYKGKNKAFTLKRQVKCGCEVVLCASCSGKGKIRVSFDTETGFSQKITRKCENCDGCGIRGKSNECECKGFGVRYIEEPIQITIPEGAAEGFEITLRSKGDENITGEIDDLVFVVKQKLHNRLKRKGDNLYLTQQISVHETYLGVIFNFMHLDGKIYNIRGKPEITRNGINYELVGLGMKRIYGGYGNLIINFEVNFTESHLSNEQIKTLRKIFNLPSISKPPDNVIYYNTCEDEEKSDCVQQ